MQKPLLEMLSQLKLDEYNFAYAKLLYQLYLKNDQQDHQWNVAKDLNFIGNESTFHIWPWCLAPQEILSAFPVSDYNEVLLSTERNIPFAYLYRPLNAGIGSNIVREKYLRFLSHKYNLQIPLGAKSTNLFIPQSKIKLLSIAQAKFLNLIKKWKEGHFQQLWLQNFSGPQTQEGLQQLWHSSFLLKNKETSIYQLSQEHSSIRLLPAVLQSLCPTIINNSSPVFNQEKLAPMGHGFYGVYSILDAIKNAELYTKNNVVSFISNGEDLNAIPDPLFGNWMLQNNIPIALFFTEKTNEDLKGGQLVIGCNKSYNINFLKLFELAQAKHLNLEQYFTQWGIEIRRRESLFNTNIVAINYKALIPIIRNLLNKSKEDLYSLCSPDLIINKKSSADPSQDYFQIEGALGTSLLNFDKNVRKHLNESCVHIVRVRKESRYDLFTPIKNSFDFYRYFFSSAFQYNEEEYRLTYQKIPNKLESIHPLMDIFDLLQSKGHY